MANLNLPIDNTLVQRIDAVRGYQPRVSWIRDAINEKLGTATLDIQPPERAYTEAEVQEARSFGGQSRRHAPNCKCGVCQP